MNKVQMFIVRNKKGITYLNVQEGAGSCYYEVCKTPIYDIGNDRVFGKGTIQEDFVS